MNRTTSGLLYCLLSPDEGTGDGGNVPAESAPSLAEQEAAPAAAPVAAPQAEQAPAAAAGQPDWQAQAQAYQRRYEEQAKFLQNVTENQSRELAGIKELFHKTFDPKGYEASKQPQYMTREDFQAAQREFAGNLQNQQLRQQIQNEMPAAMEKFPMLKSFYGANAERRVMSNWINGDYRTIIDAAKDMAGEVEGFQKAQKDAAQKEWADAKKKQQAELGGASAAGKGAKPQDHEPPDARGKGRGKKRFGNIDFDKAFKDAKDSLE